MIITFRAAAATAAVAITLAMAPAARADLVTNGSFATGDFAGWTLGGDSSYDSVGQAGGQFTGEIGAPTGNSAYLGTAGGVGTLSQTLSTVAGQKYLVSFELQSDTGTIAPNYLTTSFGGTTLPTLSVSNVGQVDWQTYSAIVTAGIGSTSTLEFTVSNDPSYFEVTGVSVSAVPLPAALPMFGAALAGLGVVARRKAKA